MDEAMGTSISACGLDKINGRGQVCPLKCLLSRLCFSETVMFPAKVGLMWGDDELGGLCIVRVR